MAIVPAVTIRILASCGRTLSSVPAIQAMSGESSPPPTGDSQKRIGCGRPAGRKVLDQPTPRIVVRHYGLERRLDPFSSLLPERDSGKRLNKMSADTKLMEGHNLPPGRTRLAAARIRAAGSDW